jgi:hypothetical protein
MSMIRPRSALVLAALVFLLTVPSTHCRADGPARLPAINLADYAGGSVMEWLKKKGFTPEQDMKDQGRITLSAAHGALVMEAKAPSLGLLMSPANIAEYSRIRIEWGVLAFPPGTSYERGVRSDAVMVYVFFGDKKLPSGSVLVPDSPYFLGLFLCNSDRIGYPYIGRYFKQSGRYVCLDRARVGATVTSQFSIAAAFQRFFKRDEALPISGIAIAIDTKSAEGDGSARGFVKRIEFLP